MSTGEKASRPARSTDMSVPRVLDGQINIFGPKFIQVKYETAYQGLPRRGSFVFNSVEKAMLFVKLAFVDLDFDAAMKVDHND